MENEHDRPEGRPSGVGTPAHRTGLPSLAERIVDEVVGTFRPELAEAISASILDRIETMSMADDVPHDPHLEAAIVGSLLRSMKCFITAADAGWYPDAHYLPVARRVAASLVAHVEEVDHIDERTPTRVLDDLQARGLLRGGDRDWVTDALVAACPSPPGVALDVARLIELADRRERLAAAEHTLALGGAE